MMDGEDLFLRRWLQTASELYDEITFNAPNDVYNYKAPDPWISFMIGAIFSAIGFGMWIRRLYLIKQRRDVPFRGSYLIRAMISTAIDSEEPFYTIASFSAFSFLFLGGLQLDYRISFIVMLGIFAMTSAGDSIRVILAFRDATSLSDAFVSSDIMESSMRKAVETELKPANVYEDLGRGRTIVIMVFITQAVLISFVVIDIMSSQTFKCPDGTPNCPIFGTFGSWSLYVLGIFMACVYILGPKTSFGQSEQNPAFWLQLLLISKRVGAKCTWYDPVANVTKERFLRSNDSHIWGRFFMSFLINGVGFHILVHALPIQVAYQSTLTGVVIRAVGMMYLVDLDDTTGYTLTLVEDKKPEKGTEEVSTPEDDPTPDWCTPEAEVPFNPPPPRQINTSELSDEAERIINEAMEKLNALKRGEASTANISMRDVAGSLLMMPRAKDVASFRVDDNGDGERAMPLSQSQNPIEGATLVKNGKGIDAGDGDGDVDPLIPVSHSKNPIQGVAVVNNRNDIEGGGVKKPEKQWLNAENGPV